MSLLTRKKALVTGGTSGIGKAIAVRFAQEGADVVILGTNEERAKKAIEEIQQAALTQEQKFSFFLVDVSHFQEVEKCVQQLLHEWHSFDVLVNNAGITIDKLFLRMSEEDFRKVIEVNLYSVFNLCKALVRSMIKQKGGKIINVSSVIGLTGNVGQVNYAASKSAILGFTKSLARELAGKQICVNCIAPGYIETPMTNQLSESVKEGVLSGIPLKRIGSPQDVAKAALFLASDLSDYVTGQVLTVDGGMVM